MDNNQNLERFFQSFRETFPFLDMSKNPVSATLFTIGLLILMPFIANKLMSYLHKDDKAEKP